jgi:membrane-bound lytic murein transglycosylase D
MQEKKKKWTSSNRSILTMKVKIFHFAFFIPFLIIGSALHGEGVPKPSRPFVSNCPIEQFLENLKTLNLFPDSLTGNSGNVGLPNPSFPDLVYEYKIAAIDNLSPINYDFNQHVKRYLDIYTIERREQVSQMLGLAELYFPLFDEILDKHQLPLEFKYLAVVESALNPLAVSPSGAVGLWQFKINSGRMFDLEVNSYVDERMDPLKSTEAACMYLLYLYRIFNDWHLVMAAYNAGPGVVRNAIYRAGGETNFWKLYDFLPEAAQNYVPAFIAATYIMQNAPEHHIEPTPPIVTFFQTDTVHVKKQLAFSVLSSEIGVSIDVLKFLNPTFRRGVVPKSKNPVAIRIPKSTVDVFLQREESMYERTPQKPDFHDVLANAGSTDNRIRVIHIVQSGDYLHKIAIKYGCTIDDISIWNPNLSSELSIGQDITLWVDISIYNKLQQEKSTIFKE